MHVRTQDCTRRDHLQGGTRKDRLQGGTRKDHLQGGDPPSLLSSPSRRSRLFAHFIFFQVCSQTLHEQFPVQPHFTSSASYCRHSATFPLSLACSRLSMLIVRAGNLTILSHCRVISNNDIAQREPSYLSCWTGTVCVRVSLSELPVSPSYLPYDS